MIKSSSLEKIFNLIDKLRQPDGCPWDRKQTPATMARHLAEESLEAYDAIHCKSESEIKDELGDVLFQLCFIIFLYEEKGAFSFEDIAEHALNKMISRHPHVFEGVHAKTVEDVKAVWADVKAGEKKKESVFDSIPSGLPALMRALKVSEAAVDVGFEWDSVDEVYEKIYEEIDEFREASKDNSKEKQSVEFGDVLFTLVNIGRFFKLESESCLLKSCTKFENRFRWMEEQAQLKGRNIKNVERANLELLWNDSKKIYK